MLRPRGGQAADARGPRARRPRRPRPQPRGTLQHQSVLRRPRRCPSPQGGGEHTEHVAPP